MSIYKRGKKGTYWYRFMWQGTLIRKSTHQTNDKKAREEEATHKAKLVSEANERSAKAVKLGCCRQRLLTR